MATAKQINDFSPLLAKQCFTKPSPRYSDTSIATALDKLGILRPSMAASIAPTLLNRNYITIKKGVIEVTDLGIRVVDFLVDSGFEFMNTHFTAALETDLDAIANGEKDKVQLLEKFWSSLKVGIEKGNQIKKDKQKTEHICPKCQGILLLKYSKFGKFLSCENYKKDGGCQYKAKIDEQGNPIEAMAKPELQESDKACHSCGEKFVIRTSKKGNLYLSCRNWNKNKSCAGFYDMAGKKMTFTKKKYYKK